MADDLAAPTGAEPDFDPNALRARYQAERDKRMRSEGEAQYIELDGDFAHFAEDDPFAPAGFTREPLDLDVDVVVIGGGFSGMMSGARLREQGIKDVRIIESGADFGGTWYWNRYPGAQCDIESYCYLPLLEELGYMPKEKYSFAPEIFEHCQRIGRHYGLYEQAIFQTRVQRVAWDSAIARWRIETNWGDDIRARYVVTAIGPASRPKLAGIPGVETFKGHAFHTARWDYDYTGGDHTGGLTKLADKRVAVIGTGATAIQCVPHVAAHAKQLYVFQRTPSSVDLRGNKPTDLGWWDNLQPGWQRARRENFADVVTGRPFEEDLVADGWTVIFRNLAALRLPEAGQARPEEAAELADFRKMNQIRARVDATVKDKATAEALKPWYRQFCKRPTFNDEFLEAFNRPNVTLVDVSAARGVERITEKGIVANGQEYEVDCIVYATGFEIGTAIHRRFDFETIGEDGVSLFERWGNGMKTLHGHSTRGFPNWFYVGLGQNALSVNFTAMFDDQARHVAWIIHEAMARQARTVQPTAEAEDAWVAEIRRLSLMNRAFLEACTPGYYNQEGKVGSGAPGGLAGESYGPGLNPFNALLAEWREKGDLDGLEITTA
jgi:cyclohexanone monooxygenase